jgi:alkyldihydroxyacetonephosphate synthase
VSVTLDRESLLVCVDGGTTLAEVESALAASGMTLDVAGAKDARDAVATWLASGARGARDAWLDPADHLLAGLDFRLHDGREIHVRPAPRRAVGPDLVALVVGTGERFGKVVRAWLRVHHLGVKRPSAGRLAVDLDPALSPEEDRLLEAMGIELARGARGAT